MIRSPENSIATFGSELECFAMFEGLSEFPILEQHFRVSTESALDKTHIVSERRRQSREGLRADVDPMAEIRFKTI